MRIGFGLLAVALAASLCGAASAAPPGPQPYKPTYGDYRVVFPRIVAEETSERYERKAVATGVGDLNGDGAEEIATVLDANFGSEGETQVVVTLGRSSSASLSDNATAFRVLVPDSFAPYPSAGLAAAVGDLNGDGRDEVAIVSGQSIYLVFGRLDGAVVNLAELGRDGFEIVTEHVDPDAFTLGTVALVSPGDMNADGLDDIAFASPSRVGIFFTPSSPAGKSFDGSATGANVESVAAPESGYNSDNPISLGAPGDFDRDGRDDLIIYTPQEGREGDVVGLMDAGPGRDLALDQVADRGQGFELHGGHFRGVVGDVNGDGRRDLAMTNDRWSVEFSPGRGVERSTALPLPGEGKALPFYGYRVWDAGDVDGDGRADLATEGSVAETGGADMSNPTLDDWGRSENRLGSPVDVVDQLQDSNGDGLPEVLGLRNEPYATPQEVADWSVETYLSRTIAPISPTGIEYMHGGVAFSGKIDPGQLGAPGFHDGAQLRPAVDLDLPDRIPLPGAPLSTAAKKRGPTLLTKSSDLNLTTGVVKAFFPLEIDPLGIGPLVSPGDRVRYRNTVVGSGTVARSPWRMFKYDPPPLELLRKKNLRRLKGTKGRDRLVGTRRSDRISSGRGDDSLMGGARGDRLLGGKGADRLVGGDGDDLLQGGPGPDMIDCGDGFDMADVGPKDTAKGCEALFRKR